MKKSNNRPRAGPKRAPVKQRPKASNDNVPGLANLFHVDAAPSAMSSVMQAGKPVFKSEKDGGMRIIHHELFGNVTNSASAFVNQQFKLQPGLSTSSAISGGMFPWLSAIAARFERYKFHKLGIAYVTKAATSESGTIYVAPDYDSADPQPGTEAQIAAYSDSKSCAPWQNMYVPLDPKCLHPNSVPKFVRSGFVPFSDSTDYDAGCINIATVSGGSTNGVGKLYVFYDISLYTPNLEDGTTAAAVEQTAMYALNGGAQTITSATPTLILFDTEIVDGIGLPGFTAGSMTMPKGAWKIICGASFNFTANEAFAGTMNIFQNGSGNGRSLRQFNLGANGTNVKQSLVTNDVIVTDENDTIAVSVTLTAATSTITVIDDTAHIIIQPA